MTPPLKQYAILPGRLYVPCELSPSFMPVSAKTTGTASLGDGLLSPLEP